MPDRSRLTFAGALMLGMLIAACAVEPVTHKVWNRSSETVDLFGIRAGVGEFQITQKLAPGYFYPVNSFGNECVEAVLIARVSGTATEIARRDGLFCPDDEWDVMDE